MTWRRGGWKLLVAFLGLAVGITACLFVATEDADAAYAAACSSPPAAPAPEEITDDAIETRNQRIEDAANCEALAERLAAIDARLAALDDAAPGTAAQRVALSRADRDRLDLAWYGAWATVGLLLVVLVAQKWYGAWRFLRE